MTNLEYCLARYYARLIKAVDRRDLKPDELRFMQRMRDWMTELQRKELNRRWADSA